MPKSCYVEGCPGDYGWGSKAWKKPTPLSFYRVPSIISEKNRKFQGEKNRLKKAIKLSKVRRKAWLKILKREHVPDCQIMQICARHFISGRPADLEDKYNPDWVPSVDMGNETNLVEETTSATKKNDQSKRIERPFEANQYDGGNSDSPISMETLETEDEESNDDSTQNEVIVSRVDISNDESSPKEANEKSTEESNECSSPKQAKISPTEESTEEFENSDFEEVEIYSVLEAGDEGPGHFHIQYCTKKACLLSKSGANMYAFRPQPKDS